MITAREELLAEQVNMRIAQMRRADRWWWLADWRDWVKGAATGLAWAVFPACCYFWSTSSKALWTDIIPFGVPLVIVGVALNVRFLRQEKTIKRLEERVKTLEESARQ
jgi:hypothetical protein